jgi:hypothetical protein
MLPPGYKDAKACKKEMGGGGDPRYLDPSKMEDGETINVRPCGTYASGHLICGYEYFSETQKKTRRFEEFPEDYLEDIGLSYKGRIEKTGEKDTPKYFMAMVVLSKEADQFMILNVPQLKLRGQMERVFAIDDYAYEGDAIAPYYFSINRTGIKKETEYMATGVLKPASPEAIERWEKAKAGIWLPALFDGADPFAGKPASPKGAAAAKPKGQPPEATDALGAVAAPSANAPGTGDSW